KKRILFLADRNVLVDQTRLDDFQPSSGVYGGQALKKRILFLADRNVLVDQTRLDDFQPSSGVYGGQA
ncbi:hypothetical protein V5H41_29975, partial [Salmonella enterica]